MPSTPAPDNRLLWSASKIKAILLCKLIKSSLFQSSGQKSLLEYFSPTNKKSEHNDTLTKGMKRKSETTGMLKVPSNEYGNLSPDVIVIDGKRAAVCPLVN